MCFNQNEREDISTLTGGSLKLKVTSIHEGIVNYRWIIGHMEFRIIR